MSEEATWRLEGWIDAEHAIGRNGYWTALTGGDGFTDEASARRAFKENRSRWPPGTFRLVKVVSEVVEVN